MSETIEKIYAARFAGQEQARLRLWAILTRHFFRQWIKPTDVVLDIGAGYCEFINSISAAKKYALDLNPATPLKAAANVIVISQNVTLAWPIADSSVDVVFSSNFFEHLGSKDDLVRCLEEARRVLRPSGRLIALGPNIRFCFDVYWDFFDHFLPLSDRSMLEALELVGFQEQQVVPRFLPYTMKNRKVPPSVLIRLYLLLPVLWRVFGKQFLVIVRKDESSRGGS